MSQLTYKGGNIFINTFTISSYGTAFVNYVVWKCVLMEMEGDKIGGVGAANGTPEENLLNLRSVDHRTAHQIWDPRLGIEPEWFRQEVK